MVQSAFILHGNVSQQLFLTLQTLLHQYDRYYSITVSKLYVVDCISHVQVCVTNCDHSMTLYGVEQSHY